MWSDWLVFCDCGFHSVRSLMEKDKRLMEAFWWERLTEGETGVVLMGRAMHSKFLIQFSVEEQGCVPSLLFDMRPNYGGGNEDNGDFLQKVPCKHYFTLVQFSHSVISGSLRPHELQHARPPCPSPTPRVHSNSHPSSRWCHPAILSYVVPFSSRPQYLSPSEAFPMSQLFTWGGQNIGISALASVLPMNTQDWSPLEWTGWISLQSKGLSSVFSNTTVQKHQFFDAQLSSQSKSHMHTWPLEKP